MRKQDGAFICPVCSCRFKHRWLTWLLTLPAAVVMGFFAGTVIPFLALFIAVILVWIIPFFLGVYEILTEGRADVSREEIAAYSPPKRKESLWFIILVSLLMLATIWLLLVAVKVL